MINFLKQYLANKHFDNSLAPDQLDIIKTQNGTGHIKKKLVFYIFKHNEKSPAMVIYSARDKQVNHVLKQAVANNKIQEDFSPRFLFEDYHHDIYFAGFEFINSRKFDLQKKSDLDLVFEYLINQYKNNNNPDKSITEFYQDIKKRFKKIGLDIDKLLGDKIDSLQDIKLPSIKQHGDLQDNNIFVVNHKLKIIDWDDYGMIDWPLFDFCTLYLKYQRKFGNDSFIEKYWTDFIKIDKNTCFVFYYLYNFLRKDKLHNRFERKIHYKVLKKDLSNNFYE